MSSLFQLTKGVERKLAPVFKTMTQGFFCGNKEWKVILKPNLVVKK